MVFFALKDVEKEKQTVTVEINLMLWCSHIWMKNMAHKEKTKGKEKYKTEILQRKGKERQSLIMMKAEKEKYKTLSADEVRNGKNHSLNKWTLLIIRNLFSGTIQILLSNILKKNLCGRSYSTNIWPAKTRKRTITDSMNFPKYKHSNPLHTPPVENFDSHMV